MEIENPYVIVHSPLRMMGKIETILAGPKNVTVVQFALAIADVTRHVARWGRTDVEDIMALVQQELDDPTTEITGSRVQ